MVPKMLHKLSYKIFAISIMVGVLAPAIVSAYVSPGKPTGYVNDFAKILDATTIQSLEDRLQRVEASNGSEIVVVTVPSLGDETVETYAVKLFEEWGIGKKGIDNGLLFLVAPNDRELKIETGYGMEGVLTDLEAGRIIDNDVIPYFKTGDYSGGIVAGVDTIVGIVNGDVAASDYNTSSGNSNTFSSNSKNDPFAIFFIFIIVINLLARLLGKTKSWWLGGVIGAIIGSIIGLIFGFMPAGITAIIFLTIFGLVFDYIVSKNPPKSGGGPRGFWPIFLGGGRGGSGGFGGGGFGGFGGGGSGGGGASGRW